MAYRSRIYVPSLRVIVRNSVATLLVLLMQGPALLVQEVAWANMLVAYTQERGWKQGVIETFDGEHPCELCKAAEKMRQGEDPQNDSAPAKAMRENLVWGAMVVPAGRFETPVPRSSDHGSARFRPWLDRHGRHADGPETPPPEKA